MKTYEAMFLMDPGVTPNLGAAEAEINRLLQRADAKVLGLKSWGERKLAYPIRQHKRGLYVLTYFEAAPEKIAGLERDVQLSEQAVRVLVLRRDTMTPEAIERALQAEPPPKVPTRGSEEWTGRPRMDMDAAGHGRGADVPRGPIPAGAGAAAPDLVEDAVPGIDADVEDQPAVEDLDV